MEPLTIITGALIAGAAAGTAEVATQAVRDAYLAFKSLIVERLGQESDVENAITQLEKKPSSTGRKGMVREELELANAANDEQIISQAKLLLKLLNESGTLDDASYAIIVSGSGSVAIGSGATAAGERGIAISGNVQVSE